MWHAKLPRVLTPEVPALSIGSHHRDVKGARADLLQKISENNEIWWTIVTYSNYVQCCAIKSMCRINMITLDRMEAPGTLLPVNSLEVDANGLSAETAIEQEIVCCRGGQCTLRVWAKPWTDSTLKCCNTTWKKGPGTFTPFETQGNYRHKAILRLTSL